MRLIADIGGTNARFAVANKGVVDLSTRKDFAVEDHSTFEACLNAYFNTAGINLDEIGEVCASVAGPVVDNTINFTNNNWLIDGSVQSNKLSCPFQLINDFEAMAYAASSVVKEDLSFMGKAVFNPPSSGSRLTVLGPGTGLGVANGMWTEHAFHPLAGEGGHTTCAASTEDQQQVIEQIKSDLSLKRVSMERILSGPGLMNLYRAMCKINSHEAQFDIPADVTRFGQQNQGSLEHQTLNLFCEFLGSCAGDIALTFGAKHGVFLVGGVTKALADFLPTSNFRTSFENKGRLSYFVENIPTAIITASDPGLRGAAVANI